jgi:hypothetical protein
MLLELFEDSQRRVRHGPWSVIPNQAIEFLHVVPPLMCAITYGGSSLALPARSRLFFLPNFCRTIRSLPVVLPDF